MRDPLPLLALLSCPQLPFQSVFRFVTATGVCAGRQILPPGVAHHERNVGTLARLERLRGHAECGMQYRARRDACEDALDLAQLAGSFQGIERTDREARRQYVRVVELWNEALVDVPQRVHPFSVARLGGNDLYAWHVLPQEPSGAHQRAGGTET